MKNLITLVKMQLKEKLNPKGRASLRSSSFKILSSALFAVLKFAVITTLFVLLLFFINYLSIFNLVKRTPTTLMSIAFGVMLVTSLISCTAGLTKAMYFSRDNAILLTLPCRPIQVFLSKLIIFFAYELKRNFGFMYPLFLAYFILQRYSFVSYIWFAVCLVFISIFTVAVGALLSIPAMWISNIFRQNRYLQIGTLVVMVTAAVFALFYAITLIPKTLDLRASWPFIMMDLQELVNEIYPAKFAWFYEMTEMFLGEGLLYVTFSLTSTLLKFLILIGVTAVMLGLVLGIALPLFYEMASKPFEYLKKSVRPRKNKARGKKTVAFLTEMTVAIKNPTRMFTNVGVLIAIPLLTFLLNRLFYAMNTDYIGDALVICFNVLIILLISLNSNTPAASVYSREGRAAYLIKTQPTNPSILLFSKLVPEALFCLAAMASTTVILITSSNLSWIDALLLMMGLIAIYVAHLMYCAELDIMNPQYEIYATVGSSDNNRNENNATFTAFLISFLTAAAVFLLLLDKSDAISHIKLSDSVAIDTVYLKLFLVAFVTAVYRVYLYFSKIKLYYKEK